MNSAKTKLRWGILGAANIARKNWKAIWNSQNGRVTAVASRGKDRALRFIEECQAHTAFDPAPHAFDSYDALLASEEVDAVYIPLPTGVRAHWVKRAAAARKHVVCEKPCATSLNELSEMLEACAQNGVQFMDGVMFMHSQRLPRLREVINDPLVIGPVRRITSTFTFRAEEEFFASNIRTRSELEPFGCLGDLGWYCIRLALWVVDFQLPQQATGRFLAEYKHADSHRLVPTEFSAELFFPNGVTSSFYCSFVTETEQWGVVTGERGHLRVPDFVLPFSGNRLGFETGNPAFHVHGCDFEMRPNLRHFEVDEVSHSHPTSQESRLFRRFAEIVQSGALDAHWPEIALKTQMVMQACYDSAMQQGVPVAIRPE